MYTPTDAVGHELVGLRDYGYLGRLLVSLIHQLWWITISWVLEYVVLPVAHRFFPQIVTITPFPTVH